MKCWHLERGLKGLNSQHPCSAFCSEIVFHPGMLILKHCKQKNGEYSYLSGIAFLTVWRLNSTTVSTYTHSYGHGVSLPLYEMKPLPLPSSRCEGRRRGGRCSTGMCGAPLLAWDVLCGASSDWWGRQGEVKSGFAFCLGSSFILARNSIYLFLGIQDW